MITLLKKSRNYKEYEYNKSFDYLAFSHFHYHTLFFKSLIFRGRKLWAFRFFQDLKYELKIRENVDPYWIFLTSVMKITPELILFPLKLGGSLHSVPLPINFKKQITFAIKWVIKLVKDQHRRISVSLIADCLVNALYDKGASMEKKLAVYNLGSSNRHLVRFFR